MAEEFVSLYEERFPKANSVFKVGISDALIYVRYPVSHHAKIRTATALERFFKEVKRHPKAYCNNIGPCVAGKRILTEIHTRVALTSCYHLSVR